MNVLSKFRCKFKIIVAHDFVKLKKSRAICNPKTGRIVRNYKLHGKINSYVITFKVQTSRIIKAGNKNQLGLHILENNCFRDFDPYHHHHHHPKINDNNNKNSNNYNYNYKQY